MEAVAVKAAQEEKEENKRQEIEAWKKSRQREIHNEVG